MSILFALELIVGVFGQRVFGIFGLFEKIPACIYLSIFGMHFVKS